MAQEEPRGHGSFAAERTFTSRDVSQIAQVSLRQLQWRDERRILSLTRQGRKRSYRPAEVVEVLVIAEFRRKGVDLRSVRRILRFLRREMEERLAPVMTGESDLYLVTDGKASYVEDDSAAIIARLKSARRPALLISLGDQAKRRGELQQGSRAGQGRRKRPRTVDEQMTLFSRAAENARLKPRSKDVGGVGDKF